MKAKFARHVQLFETPGTEQSMEFSRPEYWSGSLSLLQGIFPTQTQVSCIAGRFPRGKPKNTGMDILSLLQQIFPTQG